MRLLALASLCTAGCLTPTPATPPRDLGEAADLIPAPLDLAAPDVAEPHDLAMPDVAQPQPDCLCVIDLGQPMQDLVRDQAQAVSDIATTPRDFASPSDLAAPALCVQCIQQHCTGLCSGVARDCTATCVSPENYACPIGNTCTADNDCYQEEGPCSRAVKRADIVCGGSNVVCCIPAGRQCLKNSDCCSHVKGQSGDCANGTCI